MQMRRAVRLLCVVVTTGFMLIPLTSSRAQDKSEEVQFETADQAELRGTFYASAKGGKAACVILLHKIGGNRQQQGWDELATSLQKNFAVLSFDFRGHGDSTNVNTKFWNTSANHSIRGAGVGKSKISFKDFSPGYYPWLVNDIAAAKRYLDRQNDAGACNSSNVILIGAEDGAALGILWIASEWQRKPLRQHPLLANQWIIDREGKIPGEDIASAVWLSIPARLAGYDVGYWLRSQTQNNPIRDKVPMAFFYGDKDMRAQKSALYLVHELQRAGRDKLEMTRAKAKNTKLAGIELVAKKGLGTEEEIFTYLEKVMQARGKKAPSQRDTEKGPPLYLVPLPQFGIQLR